jgi:hypothetical protein
MSASNLIYYLCTASDSFHSQDLAIAEVRDKQPLYEGIDIDLDHVGRPRCFVYWQEFQKVCSRTLQLHPMFVTFYSSATFKQTTQLNAGLNVENIYTACIPPGNFRFDKVFRVLITLRLLLICQNQVRLLPELKKHEHEHAK